MSTEHILGEETVPSSGDAPTVDDRTAPKVFKCVTVEEGKNFAIITLTDMFC